MCDCDGRMYVCDACHDGDIIAEQRARIAELEARLTETPSAPPPSAAAYVLPWKRFVAVLRAAREAAK